MRPASLPGYRKEDKLTLKSMAEKLNYPYVYLSNIERGKVEPSRNSLKKFAEVFGISSDFVLYGDPPDYLDGLVHILDQRRNLSANQGLYLKPPFLTMR
jgi:transcriptional regulator with XRE-family HTH domain